LPKDKKDTKPEKAAEAAASDESAKQAQPAAEPEASMEDELEALKAELSRISDLLLRTAAEFDNYKRRTERERESVGAFARASAIRPLLGAVDSMERAVALPPDTPDYRAAVEVTLRQLLDALSSAGLKAFGEPGDEFDPELHNAVMHEEDESQPQSVVAEVLQKGYRLGGQLLRPAMVKVFN